MASRTTWNREYYERKKNSFRLVAFSKTNPDNNATFWHGFNWSIGDIGIGIQYTDDESKTRWLTKENVWELICLADVSAEKIRMDARRVSANRAPIIMDRLGDHLQNYQEEANELGLDIPKMPPDMEDIYICTNGIEGIGAGVIAYPDFFERIQMRTRVNCIMIPSSIHEVLLLPVSIGVPAREAVKWLRNINAKEVAFCDRLSENVYYVDIRKKRITMIDFDY